MKGLHGIAPFAIIAILAAAGVGAPTAMAEMQHRGMTMFTPQDAPYGIMRAGEAIMSMYQFNKGDWNAELIQMREMEKTQLQQRCPECTEQIQQLEQEQAMIREQERIRVQTETGQGSMNQVQTETQNENPNQGSEQGSQGGSGNGQQGV